MENKKIYYKGDLILLEGDIPFQDVIALQHYSGSFNIKFKSKYGWKNDKVRKVEKLLESSGPETIRVTDPIIVKDLEEYFKSDIDKLIKNSKKIQIIGELIQGEDHEFYLEELFTKLCFPIGNFYIKQHDIDRRYVDESIARYGYFDNFIISVASNPSIEKLNVVVYNKQVADINEVNGYLHQFTGIFHKRKEQEFINTIMYLCNKNTFNQEIKRVMEVKKEYPKPKTINTLLIDIDYNLNILRIQNQELYEKINKDYEELKKSSNLTREELAMFLGRIEASIKLDKKCINNIFEYLKSIKEQYLNNFFNDNLESILTINEIENDIILFLNVQDNYTYFEVNECLKLFAFIYLMEIYVVKNNINIEILNNSYLKEKRFLNLIVSSIIELQENGIIEKEIMIVDLNNLESIEGVLNLIVNMKRVNNDKKVKVKTK